VDVGRAPGVVRTGLAVVDPPLRGDGGTPEQRRQMRGDDDYLKIYSLNTTGSFADTIVVTRSPTTVVKVVFSPDTAQSAVFLRWTPRTTSC